MSHFFYMIRRILLDTGEGDIPQYINHLRAILINEGITLSHIFLSHWHHDHIGGVLDVLEMDESMGMYIFVFVISFLTNLKIF